MCMRCDMAQYKVGKIVKGTITGVEKYGIFVNLDNFYSGLIHISEMSDDFVKNTGDYGEVGELIIARIIEIDETTNHVKLSIKGINHRVNSKNKKTKIKETGTGFEPLINNLEYWITEKLHEIDC